MHDSFKVHSSATEFKATEGSEMPDEDFFNIIFFIDSFGNFTACAPIPLISQSL